MCQRAVCPTCRKVTYEGCGRHVEQVLTGVPTPQRCTCESPKDGRARSWSPEATARLGPVSARPGKPTRSTHVPRHPGTPDRARRDWWTRFVDWVKSPA
ncbi:hypothetical protein BOG92_037445 [Streptomyces sp. WAC00263]|nr:hypothetical protein BOG92_037445 [Streptomyces sp. WAC00263]